MPAAKPGDPAGGHCTLTLQHRPLNGHHRQNANSSNSHAFWLAGAEAAVRSARGLLEGLQKWKKERLDIADFPILIFVLDQALRREGTLHCHSHPRSTPRHGRSAAAPNQRRCDRLHQRKTRSTRTNQKHCIAHRLKIKHLNVDDRVLNRQVSCLHGFGTNFTFGAICWR